MPTVFLLELYYWHEANNGPKITKSEKIKIYKTLTSVPSWRREGGMAINKKTRRNMIKTAKKGGGLAAPKRAGN